MSVYQDERGKYVQKRPYYNKTTVSGISVTSTTQTLSFSEDEPVRVVKIRFITGARCSVSNVKVKIKGTAYSLTDDVGASKDVALDGSLWGNQDGSVPFEEISFDTAITTDTTTETIIVEIYGCVMERIQR